MKLLNSVYKILTLLLFTYSIHAQAKQDTSRSSIFIQGGIFESYHSPRIIGFQTVNLGFIQRTNKKRDWGISFLANLGNSNKIIERQVYFPDSSTVLIGGNKSFKEFEVSYFMKRNYLKHKSVSAGVISSIGLNYTAISTNPDPEGAIIKRNNPSLSFKISPYFEIDISQKISIFGDMNFLKILQGYELYSKTELNSEKFENEFVTTNLLLPFTDFHLGIQFHLN